MNGTATHPGATGVWPQEVQTSHPSADLVGWCVTVSAYRFFIAADQVDHIEAGSAIHAVHHLPSWLAGVALVRGRLLGVLDLGRFLGVAKTMNGVLLVPHQCVGRGWGLQVHEVAPVHMAVEDCSADDVPAEAAALAGALIARPRPGFSQGRVAWMGDGGDRMEADRLCLARLLAHPRLKELQS